MVTMVYSLQGDRDSRIAYWIAAMTLAGEMFTGPRSFGSWPMAVAYANLAAAVGITQTPRRRVYALPNGRWGVVQTTRTYVPAAERVTECPWCPDRLKPHPLCHPGGQVRHVVPVDPCALGCIDPARHAEGGHDV